MVGLTLALLLARAGVATVLIERKTKSAMENPAKDGRTIAVALGSRRILEGAGAWVGMAEQASPILDIAVIERDAPFHVHYDHRDVGGEPLGHIVEHDVILRALYAAAKNQPSLEILSETAVETFQADGFGCRLTLTDGREVSAKLAVAADGRRSTLRDMAKIGVQEKDYKQIAITCTLACAKPHDGLAMEKFLPSGPFAALPMLGNRVSIVWTEPRERGESLMRVEEALFMQALRERMGDFLGEVMLEGKRYAYPLTLSQAKEYIAPRLALVGDAAHAIHPLAGQGVNLGFRDAAALAELVVEQAKLGLDVGSKDALARYSRWRRFDAIAMIAATDGLNRLFSTDFMPLKVARNLGFGAVNVTAPLKRFLMRHAMGMVGKLPKVVSKSAA